jgi:hypothetical protein
VTHHLHDDDDDDENNSIISYLYTQSTATKPTTERVQCIEHGTSGFVARKFKKKSLGSKIFNIPTNNISSSTPLAERQFLLEELTLNKEMSVIYRAGTRRTMISRSERQI